MYLVDKKYTLAKMYGRMRGYEAPAMSDAQFNRKRELCTQVLAVMDKIIPGRMRKRGKNGIPNVCCRFYIPALRG